MKKLVIICLISASSLLSKAQSDNSRIEQYCQLIVTQRLLSNKVTIDLDYGDEKSYWNDNRMKTPDGKLKKFNTVIDAMNFMGMAGWTFINAYPVRTGDSEDFHFAFKKQFLKTDFPTAGK